MSLTDEERQIAINQLTCLDLYNRGYHIVPIPPKSHGGPDRWVAVEPHSQCIQTDIQQPDPEKAVLCATRSYRCGYYTATYCYGDKLSCYIISSIIFTAIFSVITTPLLLLFCIPMIRNLVKVSI
jgi:hypothetical protein